MGLGVWILGLDSDSATNLSGTLVPVTEFVSLCPHYKSTEAPPPLPAYHTEQCGSAGLCMRYALKALKCLYSTDSLTSVFKKEQRETGWEEGR